jgi:hypothetical protein
MILINSGKSSFGLTRRRFGNGEVDIDIDIDMTRRFNRWARSRHSMSL